MRAPLLALCVAAAAGVVVVHAQSGVPTLASLKATRDRPLFSPTRRPPPSAAARTVRLATPPPQVELTGVIFGSYQQTAILQQSGKSEPKFVQLGTILNGWKVTSITPRSIVFTRAERSVEMQLSAHNAQQADDNK